MATKNYIKAKEYYNLQPGWVLHHKDVYLKKNDPERYNEWRIETGTTYKCLRDAEKDFKGKISRPSISKSASNHITIKGYTFEFVKED